MTRPSHLRGNDSFGTRRSLAVGDATYEIQSLARLDIAAIPYSLRVVLENLLRHEDGRRVTPEQVELILGWGQGADHQRAVDLSPSRVFLHDTNGVPALVDLAAMRHALVGHG